MTIDLYKEEIKKLQRLEEDDKKNHTHTLQDHLKDLEPGEAERIAQAFKFYAGQTGDLKFTPAQGGTNEKGVLAWGNGTAADVDKRNEHEHKRASESSTPQERDIASQMKKSEADKPSPHKDKKLDHHE